jgi:hypothetical protein
MRLKQFCEIAVRLRGKPFSLEGRPYLEGVYRSNKRRMVIRASRQVEKSTFVANRLLFEAYIKRDFDLLAPRPRFYVVRVPD